jgi:indolepyruvate ferredoxin oxidoreductase, alpha subunit
MSKMILLGDDAVAQAAIDAGVTCAYGYPGTPSTEILEYVMRAVKKDGAIHATWAANEKVALEQAVGTSFAGRRVLVTMKHVGLNVAADPFMNSTVTGAGGGLVLAVADDPGMHSSQNEQDSRIYGDFAMTHCFEPSNQQESYDMTREAFDASEKFENPVLVRLVTRLAHSRADVEVGAKRAPNPLAPSKDRVRWTLLPTNARPLYRKLVEKQPAMRAYSEESRWNELHLDPARRDLGVIVSGIAANYFHEALGEDLPSFLKVGLYPLPREKIRRLLEHVARVLVLEEGYPFIERQIADLEGKAMGRPVLGRFTGHLPLWGELTPDLVARALGREAAAAASAPGAAAPLVARPPQLCAGCPHSDTYRALNVLKQKFAGSAVFSDIGCYTLGFYPPFETIDSCLDMGASISMAKGASDAGMHPVFCVIGDSTFGHSGITPLLTAAHEDTDMVVVILDNSTVAMTGKQESLSTGDRLLGIVAGVGVPKERIRVLRPLPKNHDENARIIDEEVSHKGLSVIIAKRECLELK